MDSAVELTDVGDYDEAAISNAWPDKVFYNGESVFETFYSDAAMNDAWSFVEDQGYDDGQEAYLGYDPNSDKWLMGFDVFPMRGDTMEGLVIELDGSGRPLDVMGGFPGGMYPAGLRGVKKSFPSIVNVRLD